MRKCNIDIKIEFCATADKWEHILLEPAEFFGVDPSKLNEEWDIGSPWLYKNPIHYVVEKARGIKYLRVVLTDRITGISMTAACHYWGGNENYSETIQEFDNGVRTRYELIHVKDVPSLEHGSQVLQINLSGNHPETTMNVVLHGEGCNEFTVDWRELLVEA